ncbi:hypothetical protein [Variovorax sp. KK3]|uniref:hypothetical protein n=1 Tax=Variovorax sp. KK3 TaxID=1855728 RepID=UPI00117CE63F|nr:hypothetical protein [Variovorax sp. KK3]
MKMLWNYGAVALLTLAAAAIVAGGEPANAELRLAEAARSASVAETAAPSAPSMSTSTFTSAAPDRKHTVP